MSELRGNAAVRHIVAELLNTADWLAINVRSVSARTYDDGVPVEADVWFHTYEDAQTFADHYGIGDRVNANLGDWTLVYFSRNPWEAGCPSVAGLRLGLRLTAERRAAA